MIQDIRYIIYDLRRYMKYEIRDMRDEKLLDISLDISKM